MSPETKQRMVGVIVLVAFAVLLIPFIFSNGIKKKQYAKEDEMPLPTKKRELAAQQIRKIDNNPDISQGEAAFQTPDMDTVVIPPPQPNPEAEELDEGSRLPAEFTQETTPAPTPAPKKPLKLVKAVPVPAGASLKTKGAKLKPATINSSQGKNSRGKTPQAATAELWSVQVGSFSDPARVQKLVTELQQAGLPVFIQRIKAANNILTRVLIGQKLRRGQADNIIKQLSRDFNIKGRLVRSGK